MKRHEMTACPRCEGRGDEIDQRKIRYDSLEPPYVTCPECGVSKSDYELVTE